MGKQNPVNQQYSTYAKKMSSFKKFYLFFLLYLLSVHRMCNSIVKSLMDHSIPEVWYGPTLTWLRTGLLSRALQLRRSGVHMHSVWFWAVYTIQEVKSERHFSFVLQYFSLPSLILYVKCAVLFNAESFSKLKQQLHWNKVKRSITISALLYANFTQILCCMQISFVTRWQSSLDFTFLERILIWITYLMFSYSSYDSVSKSTCLPNFMEALGRCFLDFFSYLWLVLIRQSSCISLNILNIYCTDESTIYKEL